MADPAREDDAMEQAAIALCWAARPVLVNGPPSQIDPISWWQMQSENDRRLYLYRAGAACMAWERYWQIQEQAHAAE